MQTSIASNNATVAGEAHRFNVRVIGYWLCTAAVVWEMCAGTWWDLLRIEYVRSVFDHLGYPYYLLFIIGIWKLPCAVTLFIPGFLRLKEWAYAGAVFNYTGAAASHIFVGDGPSKWVGPLIFAILALASWALRPSDRRIPRTPSPSNARPSAWIIPLAVIAAFLVIALLTLPKSPPSP